ncbi:Soluble aldose sugar dehydrogenase YliI precursor [Rubripirellula lacrimiformis]|uniref:Soluble aldose sugar dehydrogenase YliI n=1 Tax=Rubripirellula lacrimiformis TaxID=1930273 RepID=A0A517NCE1_9BACT|nr:family 16 glycoside hydrolase [Rubripirellula lacrimiformis]QDT04718.1 Soluble aldose sugar dehydrogenase YliI precursor [Rubripirellula lacrimiformis]
MRFAKRHFATVATSVAMSLPLSLAGPFSLAAPLAHAETPVNQLSQSEQRSGWKMLFDGKTTDGWRNYKKDKVSDGWKIEDGALVRSKKGAGDIITKDKYGSFELSLEYKISEAGNSGVMFHVAETDGPPWHTGPEIQVQDNVDGHDPQKAGWLYQLYKPSAPSWSKDQSVVDSTRPAGQWNQLYIRIAKNDCEVCMNGVRYFRFKLGNKDWKERVAASKFAKLADFGSLGEGYICLQDHNDLVSYRNIKVREIADDGSVPQPIDGKLGMSSNLAFPNLKWDQWEAVDDSGKIRDLRLLELTFANDDSNRLYAASQYGAIWSFDNQADVSDSKLVLDLRGKVHDWKRSGANEQGLLGLAMHPDFKNTRHFYVYYSHPSESKSVLSRFTMSKDNPLVADPASELVLMEIDQPYQNHNGGSIEFGPDGFLYVSLGDGGDRNDPHGNGQNLATLLGSILRIDVDHPADGKNYGIPADNPFVDVKDARPEIFAYGMRNPWRIAFDPKTGDLWAGDVGQELWEEVDVITKGGNYGWSTREGSHAFGNRSASENASDPIEPVWEYDHQIGKSITGGRVYRNSRLPQLDGRYIYADYVTGSVWALTFDPATKTVIRNEQIIPDSVAVLAFGQDAAGEVYVLTNSTRGECIYRFDGAAAGSEAAKK